MASSQQHGFIVEEIIKREFDRLSTLGGIAPPQIHTRYTARFDIPAHRDLYGKALPTSIKSAQFRGGKTLVCLSDAVRIAGLQDAGEMRLIVALYRQDGNEKVVSEVREYVMRPEEWQDLMGGAPVDVVESFHEAIKVPDHTKARKIARKWKEKMAEEYPSAMRWNPKIDSKNQRRLQCSVRLEDIEAAIVDKSRIRVFGKELPLERGLRRPKYLCSMNPRLWGDGQALPFRIQSPPRQRSVKPAPPPTPPSQPVQHPQASRLSRKSMVK